MAKSLIPEIAKMLGVEIGEEFKIKGREYIFWFDENGLIALRYDGSKLPSENCSKHFGWLLNGGETIVKLPWRPKVGEVYWTFGGKIMGDPTIWAIAKANWCGLAGDILRLEKGWVYRTRKEAEAALPAVAEELGVEYEL